MRWNLGHFFIIKGISVILKNKNGGKVAGGGNQKDWLEEFWKTSTLI